MFRGGDLLGLSVNDGQRSSAAEVLNVAKGGRKIGLIEMMTRPDKKYQGPEHVENPTLL